VEITINTKKKMWNKRDRKREKERERERKRYEEGK